MTTSHCFQHPRINPSLVMLAMFSLLDFRLLEKRLYHTMNTMLASIFWPTSSPFAAIALIAP